MEPSRKLDLWLPWPRVLTRSPQARTPDFCLQLAEMIGLSLSQGW